MSKAGDKISDGLINGVGLTLVFGAVVFDAARAGVEAVWDGGKRLVGAEVKPRNSQLATVRVFGLGDD